MWLDVVDSGLLKIFGVNAARYYFDAKSAIESCHLRHKAGDNH